MKRLTLAFLLSVVWSTANAQEAPPINPVMCNTTPSMQQSLTDKWKEFRLFTGLISSDVVLEIWVRTPNDQKQATWTMLLSFSNGMTCAYTAGVGYQMSNPPPNL